jgi:predicted choloylglycine hydrolase
LLYRTILEECRTVDEAIALLEKTPRQTANNLMLMDASGARAVAEITPESLVVRRAPANQSLISTNHHRGTDLDTPSRCTRYDYLHDTSAAEFGKIDRAEVQSMLSHVAQGNMTLQSMVFEPSHRVIYLSTGAHATALPYHRLDLAKYFND